MKFLPITFGLDTKFRCHESIWQQRNNKDKGENTEMVIDEEDSAIVMEPK